MTSRELRLPGLAPGGWLAAHICTHLTPETRAAAVPTHELLADGWFARRFAHLLQEGTPRALAANQLAAAFVGTVGMELGYAFVGAGAGFLPDVGDTRWVIDDGWVDGVVFPADTGAVVLPGHPWAERPDVVVAADVDELHRRTVEAVVAFAEPLVDHLAEITRAGRLGFWHEVSDGFPSVLSWDGTFPLSSQQVSDFTAMSSRPGLPWRRPPALEIVEDEHGATCVRHRGGCCMEYLARRDRPDPTDEAKKAFRAAFPVTDRDRIYCDDCKFHPREEARARQLWWWHRAAVAPGP